MPSFMYYLPVAVSATKRDIESRGIALDGRSYSYVGTNKGPDGHNGYVILPSGSDFGAKIAGYYPNEQTWKPCAKGNFWLGWWNGKLPTPEELEHETTISGHLVRLEDGHDWLIPIARRFPQGSAMPARIILNEDGEWKAESLPRYANLTADADRVFEDFMLQDDGDPAVGLTSAEMADIAAAALAINYHLSRWECSALGVLTTDNIQHILGALIDLPTIKAHLDTQKKKASATANT